MNQQLSPDGRWLWDGYRWVPAPQSAPPGNPRVIGRRRNWLLVFAILAATSILWGPLGVFLFIWASAYWNAGAR